MSDFKEIKLIDIAAQFSDIDIKFQYFHGKLFSFIPPEPEKFFDFLGDLKLSRMVFPNSHPATVLVGRMASLVQHQISPILTLDDNRLQILFEVADRKLSDSNYLAIISPAERSGANTSYALAFESINFVRSTISVSFGKLPFYAWIADFDFDAKGTISLPGEAVRRPLHADFFKIIDVSLLNEITARLALQQADYRHRLQRACDFFNMAMNQKDEAFRFSSYWISLEIIVGGTADAIRAELSKAYEQGNKTFANQSLLFDEIEDVRHDLLHKGIFRTMFSYHERLMQLYFWDIVIHQIGLKPRGLAAALVKSGMIESERAR